MDQELYERIQKRQYDSYFRKNVSGGYGRVVDAPFLHGSVASAFERMTAFDDAVLELARLGTHVVHFMCWGIDAVEDDLSRLSEIPALFREGAIAVRHMAGGRC